MIVIVGLYFKSSYFEFGACLSDAGKRSGGSAMSAICRTL